MMSLGSCGLVAVVVVLAGCGDAATGSFDGNGGSSTGDGAVLGDGGTSGTAPDATTAPLSGCDDLMADPDELVDLYLRMSRQEWYDLARDTVQPNGECNQFPYHAVEFRCGVDEPWISIGVRRKRGDHFGLDNPQKPLLKLDFNEVVPGQTWPVAMGNRGYRKLTLNNGQPGRPDHSLPILLSEELAWRLMRVEIPEASKTTYSHLYVEFTDDGKTEYHGIYQTLEDINRSALRRRYDDTTGTLHKSTGSSCDGPMFEDVATNMAEDLFSTWDAKSPTSFPTTWLEETESAMHLDHLLRQEAVRGILVNFASALGRVPHNYLTYDKADDLRLYLPWDMDQAFREPGWPVDEGVNQCDAGGQFPTSRIALRTRCEPQIEDRFLEHVCELINTTLSADNILAEAAHLDGVLRPLLPAEIAAIWGGRINPLSTNDDSMVTHQEQYEHLQTWVPARIDNVRAQLEAAGMSCPAP